MTHGRLLMAVLVVGWGAQAADSALQLRYDFAAISGEIVPDVSGKGHAARLEGKDGALPNVVTTAYGQALRLEVGKGQGLRVRPATDLVCARGLTVMAWIRPEAVNSHLAILANKGDRVPGTMAKGYRLSATWGRVMAELGFGDDEEGVRLLSPEWSIEPKHWAHVALAFDGQDLVLYLNAAAAARLHLPVPRKLAAGPSAGGFTIGKYYWNDAYPFTGLLADVRVYDRALAEPEVLAAAGEFLKASPQDQP